MIEHLQSRVDAILACPACLISLDVRGGEANCATCGRSYQRIGGAWDMILDAVDSSPARHAVGRFKDRTRGLDSTIWGRLYRTFYVHPTRFLGDLQKSGVANLHRRLVVFLDSFQVNALLIDLGSGSRRLWPDIITIDIAAMPHVDILADGHRLPIRNESVDGIVVQQVLEHVRDPARVLHEAYRVLRKGGRLYCEVPFLYPVHDLHDFRRWTVTGLEMMCAQFTKVDAGVSMGPFSVLSAIARRLATGKVKSPYWEAVIDLSLGWMLAPLKYLDEAVARWPAVSLVAGAVYFEGVKA